MNVTIIRVLILSSLIPAVSGALAHDRYIVPTHTVLSGESSQSVSVISSISNDVFHPDRPFGDNGKGAVPPSLKGYFARLQSVVINPDGSVSKDFDWQAFSRLSVGDLKLESSGTYRISVIHPEFPMTTFQKADGSRGRVFGPDATLPEGATDVVRRTTASRVETFVTLNEPNRAAMKPTGKGLELGGKGHPNDLFVNETGDFQLFYDGKPLDQSAEIVVVRSGTRHRNERKAMELKTDEQGGFQLSFTEAGFYLFQAALTLPGKPESGIDKHHYSLFVTLEVFPE
ncbi:DUF4198 domain-containing protein [Sulfidibacter corallicola]|uniref:DUF4198 domain-containing protein n=1 Tax=Sulfidibacter corallicola TaxID=2818388 RepID=A0A8A4TMF5_SULCO|nr:DUF4198 domain-containing protein [Sulfidibacter corallicola]QTD50647.1 DUF4198 domain-containing protein [Sulfidibacter corallicola]